MPTNCSCDTFTGNVTVQGNLGVGTSTPVGRIDVAAAAPGGQELLNLIAGGNGGDDLPALIWKSAAGAKKLEIWTDAANAISRIKSAGPLSLHAGQTRLAQARNDHIAANTSTGITA